MTEAEVRHAVDNVLNDLPHDPLRQLEYNVSVRDKLRTLVPAGTELDVYCRGAALLVIQVSLGKERLQITMPLV